MIHELRRLWVGFEFQYTIAFTLLEKASEDKESNSESMNRDLKIHYGEVLLRLF